MSDQAERLGLVLLNLGGPERVADVRPFLYNLFSDRLIIRFWPAFPLHTPPLPEPFQPPGDFVTAPRRDPPGLSAVA